MPDARPSGHRIVRLPAGLGCLVALVAVPLALLAALVAVVRALVGRPRAPAVGTSPRHSGPVDLALCDLVRKMALDDEFDLDDARTAGLPAGADVTAESLVERACDRGWVERRGAQRYAVTPRGRAESAELLRRSGL